METESLHSRLENGWKREYVQGQDLAVSSLDRKWTLRRALAGPLGDKRPALALGWGSFLLCPSLTLKEREERRNTRMSLSKQGCQLRKEGRAAAFRWGVVGSLRIV